MWRSGRTTRLLLLCCLVSIGGCFSKPVPNLPLADSSDKCDASVRQDCWSVTPAYIQEHAILFDTAIRCRAALKTAHDKLN